MRYDRKYGPWSISSPSILRTPKVTDYKVHTVILESPALQHALRAVGIPGLGSEATSLVDLSSQDLVGFLLRCRFCIHNAEFSVGQLCEDRSHQDLSSRRRGLRTISRQQRLRPGTCPVPASALLYLVPR